MEHFALSQWAKKCGESVEAASGRDAISMRMYGEGINDVFHGWSKSFASGAKSTNILLLVLSSLWIASLITLVIHSPEMIWATSLFIHNLILPIRRLFLFLNEKDR